MEERERDDSFFELFDRSVKDSLSLIRNFFENVEKGNDSLEITGKLSFLTGLPQAPEESRE